jgi:alkanesulfonate monooxygenase SsuD/methylene tetrahydromethanopterin reductase-like flavin-dependent oxidoreductase (luciferase family)
MRPRPRLDTFLLAAGFPGRSHAQALQAASDTAVATEAAGLDGVWIAEHHFISYGLCPSAITFAAHVLGATRRIRAGTAVSILSAQHPVALAEQATLLDHLSGGRLDLGVGRGGPWLELEVLGTGLDRYERGFPEALDLLTRWLTSDRVAADGEFFRFREVPVVPGPARVGGVPVIVAATSAATVELAAARGLPVLLGMHLDDQGKRELLDRWATTAERHGHDPATVTHAAAAVAHVADTRAEAVAELRRAMPGWLGPGIAGYTTVDGRPRTVRDPGAYTEWLLEVHPVGAPADCAERLAATAERTGIGHYLLMVEGTGRPARTLETVARLGAEVAPLFGAAVTPEAPPAAPPEARPAAPGTATMAATPFPKG